MDGNACVWRPELNLKYFIHWYTSSPDRNNAQLKKQKTFASNANPPTDSKEQKYIRAQLFLWHYKFIPRKQTNFNLLRFCGSKNQSYVSQRQSDIFT